MLDNLTGGVGGQAGAATHLSCHTALKAHGIESHKYKPVQSGPPLAFALTLQAFLLQPKRAKGLHVVTVSSSLKTSTKHMDAAL